MANKNDNHEEGPSNRQFRNRDFGGYSETEDRQKHRDQNRNQSPENWGQRQGGQGAPGYGMGYNQAEFGRHGEGRSSGQGDRNWQQNTRDTDQDRGLMERAGDEVSSWFGDEGARQRRQMDSHRGKGPKGYTRSDDRIRDDVNDRLSDDHSVDASEIEVSVENGEVTLTGHVNSRDERRMAEDCVERVAGVSYVQNNLRVGAAGSRTGEQKTIPYQGDGTPNSGTTI